MEFREFFEATEHALQRLQRIYAAAENNPRAIPNPSALYSEIRSLVLKAEQIYTDGLSYAVEVYRFPFIVGERRVYALTDLSASNEPSNGNMAVAIIRLAQVRTFMFRRSPDIGRLSQPFTPQALDVDVVVTRNEFLKDLNTKDSFKRTGDKFGMVPPMKVKKPSVRPQRVLRGGI